jgi:hypothetical protein
LSRGTVDPATPVALWFVLTAPRAGQDRELRDHARLFCADADNARVVDIDPSGDDVDVSSVHVVVDGGDLAGAVRGGPAATAAVVTARTLVDRLFMFTPVLVPAPPVTGVDERHR